MEMLESYCGRRNRATRQAKSRVCGLADEAFGQFFVQVPVPTRSAFVPCYCAECLSAAVANGEAGIRALP